MTTDEVFARASELPEEARAELAHILLVSLHDSELDAESDEAFVAELERRSQEIADGRATLFTREEAEARIRAQILGVHQHAPVESRQPS